MCSAASQSLPGPRASQRPISGVAEKFAAYAGYPHTGERTIADIGELRSKYQEVRELTVSNDGERVAVTVKGEEGITPCTNGEPWEANFEKAWCLRFLPTGSLLALVMTDDEWTVGVDGEAWDETFDFAWN